MRIKAIKLKQKVFSKKELAYWKQNIFNIYEKMQNKSKVQYSVKYGGLNIEVIPGVYAPEFFDDTLWFAKELSKITKDKTILEIGCGTGYIGLYCILKGGKSSILLDFNKLAVKNALLNKKKLSVKNVVVKYSNIYSSLKKEKFDVIFWAHPFNSWDIKTNDKLILSGIDPNYKYLDKYISQAKKYMNKDGRLLLGTGNSANLKLIAKLAEKNNYEIKLLKESKRQLEKGNPRNYIVDYLIEFVKN